MHHERRNHKGEDKFRRCKWNLQEFQKFLGTLVAGKRFSMTLCHEGFGQTPHLPESLKNEHPPYILRIHESKKKHISMRMIQ
jgi:hypothetical protein